MLTRTVHNLPFHSLDPGQFEELCLALVCREIDPNAQHLGAAGADEGYDIRAQVDGKVVCYQCKRYERFGLSAAKAAIDTVMAGEEPPDEIVLVVSRDVSRTLRRDANAHSPVPCSFWARSELEERVWRHRDIRERFFGHIEPPPTQAPLWNIPQGVRFFTGRDTVLQDLRQALTDTGQAALGQSLAVFGLGGIGKTQTAIAYAHQYRDAYSFAFWIAAENETTLRASFSEIAGILELPEIHEPEEDRMLAAVLRAWASREGGLLVYDNVEDPDLVKRFTPNPQTHHVVVTSRLQTLRRYGFPLLELPVLAPDDAVRFLHERTGRQVEEDSEEHQAAVDLAEELGYLPLALEQAAAYIDTRGMSFGSYLATYRKAGVEWIDRLEAVDHPESVLKTWNLNLQQVEEKSPQSIQLFRILAFLAPDDVPEFLFESFWVMSQTSRKNGQSQSGILDDLLEPLLRFSLIRRDWSGRAISVHPLVQQVTRLTSPKKLQRRALEQAINLLKLSFPNPLAPENWEVCERLLPHNRSIQSNHNIVDKLSPNLATLFNKTADYCSERARYDEAEFFYLQSLRIKEAALGREHLWVATTLNDLACLYSRLGRYDEAEPLFVRSLRIKEAALGKEHVSFAGVLNNFALLRVSRGDYAGAEPLYLRSLEISKSNLGEEHLDVANTLENLATLYVSLGRYEEADSYYEDSLKTKMSGLGVQHPDIAKSLSNQAFLRMVQGRHEDAESLYLRSLSIKERVFGDAHPRVARVLGDLGNLYYNQGRHGEAESLYMRCLRITEKALGKEHPHVTRVLTDLANLYVSQGQGERAGPLLLRSLRVAESTLGAEHSLVGDTLKSLANLYVSTGRYEEARSLYERSVQVLELSLGNDHPSVAQSLERLAILNIHQGMYKEAEVLLLRSLCIKEAAFDSENPEVGSTLDSLASLLRLEGRLEEAEDMYRRSLLIKEKNLGGDHPQVASTLNNLALLLASQRQYVKAEPLLQRAFEICMRTVGPKHPNTAQVAGSYENFLRKLDRNDEADALRQEFNQALAAEEQSAD